MPWQRGDTLDDPWAFLSVRSASSRARLRLNFTFLFIRPTFLTDSYHTRLWTKTSAFFIRAPDTSSDASLLRASLLPFLLRSRERGNLFQSRIAPPGSYYTAIAISIIGHAWRPIELTLVWF